MKIWIKYLIGIALGIIAAFVLPENYMQDSGIITFISDIGIRLVRFLLVPMLFFSFTVAIYKLRITKTLFKTFALTAFVIVATSVLITLVGLLPVLLIKFHRIPITTDRIIQTESLNLLENIRLLFPYSGFEALLNGVYLLPTMIFAFLAGAGSATDRVVSKPAVTLFDSLSKICYTIMNFFIDFFAVGLIAVTSLWVFTFLPVLKSGVYTGIIIMLAVDLAIIALIIYPLALRLIYKELHPYRVLYASVATFFAGFLSGDTNLTLAVAMRHGNESLGIKRRTASATFPIFAVFARGGSALVTVVSFIVILRSYSALSISFSDIVWISSVSLLLSFLLGALPTGGTFFALTILCSMYGRSLEAGYLLLKPIAFFLGSVATGIDSLTMVFGSYMVAHTTNTIERKELKHFI